MMSTDAISLPDDLTLCHSLIAQQHEQLLELQRQVQHLKYLNEYLTRKIYGRTDVRRCRRGTARRDNNIEAQEERARPSAVS
jgi:hypothetical protein